ncbi:hypothetical protein [Psychrobacter sp. Ps3]|jgi:ribosomal protein L7/L12|uniref:hypothetical protein n=1 Tax=Psychrobacter sp. Ps3 TaxID=2790957 RepID=UPI000EB8D309|nr:hypothetical protein [Psychrobacter sp. Ps3]MCG3881972.1 hypothetical protein [Psychrobacter sp. Ps3]HAM61557.1 hypothetical protein [Psychrobacter sp.]|tara:strand:+ start:324 stop:563 length:240 start_codon:yes stop_codon:yes gene_type:complete
MLTIIVWAVGAALLLINIFLRTRILRLEGELKKLRSPQEYMTYLRQQNVQDNKVAAIKTLRKQYPELSLIEANSLYENL